MMILPRGVVVISNEDLKPCLGSCQYAELNAAVVAALEPRSQDDGAGIFPILRVTPGTKAFQLPKSCILLALQGKAVVQATGGCGIWYGEDLDLKADLAIVGAGRINRLECEEVVLLSKQEVEYWLEDLVRLDGVAPRLVFRDGYAKKMSCDDEDAKDLENSLGGIEVVFEVQGNFSVDQLSEGIKMASVGRQVDSPNGDSMLVGESVSNRRNQARGSRDSARPDQVIGLRRTRLPPDRFGEGDGRREIGMQGFPI